MQKIRKAKKNPDPHKPLRGMSKEAGLVIPPPERREGWLGNPPWLKREYEEKTKDK